MKPKRARVLPHIMRGINQTTMFAFSMVIIAAFIGTIDLGQAIFKALPESNLGNTNLQ